MRVTLVCGYMDGASTLITTKMVPNHVTDKSDKDYMINVSWVSLAKVEALSGNKLWTPNHYQHAKTERTIVWQAEPALHSIRMNQSLPHINHWFPWIRGPGNNTPYFWGGSRVATPMVTGDSTRGSTMIQIEILDPRIREPQKKLEEKPAYQKLPTKCI